MRADDKNVASGGAGRDSIRISSNSAFSDSVTILDLQHMPGGCGQWPAFWTTQLGNWPGGGEVDIIEVNDPILQSLAKLRLIMLY